MGVKGLWSILEPVGYPVNLESLEGAIIAVDISIWLNQSIKGIRDKRGILAENAHILGLFNRICKLLFYKIKPVFVFDGGTPALKRQTIEKRKNLRENAQDKAKTNMNKVLKAYISDQLQTDVNLEEDVFTPDDVGLGLKQWDNKEKDLFVLPSVIKPIDEEDEDLESDAKNGNHWEHFNYPVLNKDYDPSLIDTESQDFKSLPPEIRHEILSDLKARKKKLNKVEAIPKKREEFSNYQMNRVLLRRKIQQSIEMAESEMVKNVSQKASENFDNGDSYEGMTSQKVMSDDTTHYVFLNKRKLDEKSIQKKLLRPSEVPSADEPDKKFIARKNIDEMFCKVGDYDFGISIQAGKDGAKTLRDRLKQEESSQLTFFNSKAASKQKSLVYRQSDTDSKNKKSHSSDDESDSSFIEVKDESIDDKDSSLDELSVIQEHVDEDLSQKCPEVITISDSLIRECEKPFETSLEASLLLKECEKPFDPSLEISALIQECEKPFDSSVDQSISNNYEPKPSTSKANHLEISPVKSFPNRDIPNSTRMSTPMASPIKTNPMMEATTPTKPSSPIKKISPNKLSPKSPKKSNRTPVKSQDIRNMFQPITPPKITAQSTLSDEKFSKKVNKINYSPPKTPNTKQNKPTITISPSKIPSGFHRADSLNQELQKMRQEMKKVERQTSTVAYNMIADCRELLAMFGIPYVMSPMEAEAQCAALEMLGLTKGTITDDSDIWLFGGQTVYRNFFNQSKYVEMYKLFDIQEKLALDRETMICFSLLTGCDYTEGIEGCGQITAMEILSEFSGKGIVRLKEFKEWWMEHKFGKNRSPGSKKRAKFLKLCLSESFPSEVVVNAFLHPTVLESNEPFSWGMPDLDLLRKYAAFKMKWSKEKIDSVLDPIIKKLNQKTTQLRMDQFTTVRVNNNKMFYTSKRLADAVNKISNAEPGTSKKTVEALGNRAKLPMSKLREKVKNQRKKNRNLSSDESQSSPIKKAQKPRAVSKKRAKKIATIDLSESSSDD